MYTITLTTEQTNEIIVGELKYTRSIFLEYMEAIKVGRPVNMFYYNDDEADIAEMQRHINALNLLISWYGVPEN